MSEQTAVKGDWVRLHIVAMKPEERTGHLPEDTKGVPLEMWVKGFLQNDSAACGDEVQVKTRTGRLVKGTLTEINPSYSHSFGQTIPELLHIGPQVREMVFGGELNNG
ncbi:MAG: 2-amino-4-oxopentanoate thiolase subunit OrtA [bacterium]|nr:2-amino-4-oxopentanoate thiolase subunit OrtA [bacterium]